MSKRQRTKKLSTFKEAAPPRIIVDTVVDFFIPDDIWCAISEHIPWTEPRTLIKFISLSRGMVRFALPQLRALCKCIIVPVDIKPMHWLLEILCFHLESDKTNAFSQFSLTTASLFKNLTLCAGSLIETADMTLWREHGVMILSTVRLVKMREQHNIALKSNTRALPAVRSLRIRKPKPSDDARKVYHWHPSCPLDAKPTHQLKNVRFVTGMPPNNPEAVKAAYATLKTRSEKERQLYGLALKHATSNYTRAICFYVMVDTLKIKEIGEYGPAFKDLVFLTDKEEPIHVYSKGCAMVDDFLHRCATYTGNPCDAGVAIRIETNWVRWKSVLHIRFCEVKPHGRLAPLLLDTHNNSLSSTVTSSSDEDSMEARITEITAMLKKYEEEEDDDSHSENPGDNFIMWVAK